MTLLDREFVVVEVGGRTSTRIAGGLLAAMGASVLRLEPSDLAPADPDAHPGSGVSESDLAVAFDRGKRVEALPTGELPKRLREVLPGARVLLTSAEAAGLEEFARRRHEAEFPGVHVHLSPFGLTGPYAGYRGTELNTAAFGGLAVFVGEAGREPLVPPMMLTAYLAALDAVVAALAGARTGGGGRCVDIAEFATMATNHMIGLYSLSLYSGPITRRTGRRKPNPYPFTLLPCKDGFVCTAFLSTHHWLALVEAMGSPEWSKDPRFRNRRTMGERYADELDELVGGWLTRHTKAELLSLAASAQIPLGPVHDLADLLEMPALEQRGGFDRVHHDGREVRVPSLPFVDVAAPAPGEAPSPVRRSQSGLPLAGLRVLDLGWVVSAPTAGQMLADLGADVVKVESWSYLDQSRRGLPILAEEAAAGDEGLLLNVMPHYHAVNRNKRSIALNLKTEAGRTVLRKLVAGADVVLENLGAGSLERLDLPVSELHALRPGLVVLRISMMGQTGELARVPGFAPQSTAMGALDALCGYPDSDPSGLISTNFGDIAAGLFGTCAVLAALDRAGRTGEGATLDQAMVQTNAFVLGPALAAYQRSGRSARPQGNEHREFSPHGMYRCAGDDEWLSVAVRTEQEWQALCALVGAPDEAATLDTPAARRAARNQVDSWITAWTVGQAADSAFHEAQRAGVCAAPAVGPEELIFDQHIRDRNVVVETDHEGFGSIPIYGTPLVADPPMATVRRRAPDLGEHTLEILAELSLADAQIAQLAGQGAFDGQLDTR